MSDRFVYVTYVRTTPETLWDHLTKPEFIRVYWFGVSAESDWKPGSSWKLMFSDGRVADTGEVVEVDRPRRLVSLRKVGGLSGIRNGAETERH